MNSNEIHFHAPGLRRFKTSEYAEQDARRFVSVSVTGTACALACDHCNMNVLHGMIPLPKRAETGLYDLCLSLRARGARGILVSGGCDHKGRVPLLPHIADLKRVRTELGFTIRVHTGLIDEHTARALREVDIHGAMIDIIGADETIREVYHLDGTTADYEQALIHLETNCVPTVPHIILGLHYGRMRGEYHALEMVARHPPQLLVLIVLMPLYGTTMADVTPPSLEDISAFFRAARAQLPDTPIMLGCARPLGALKAGIDRAAIDAGLNGIAYPAEGMVTYAQTRGLTPKFHDACCGVFW
jgi:uncharacterized radical SAM superfamily protein